MSKTALITGIAGQDGSYLTELLLENGYDVHGIDRRSSLFNRRRIEEARENARRRGQVFELYYGDMSDSSNLYRRIISCKPTEIYNFASQSHVAISFEEPEHTTDVNANGTLRLLEAARHFAADGCRFYQASTSEMFGDAPHSPQTENTPFHPRSPYGVAKLYAYWIVRNYREHYGLHACNGILYNHESPRRGENFVTRKITYSLARIKKGLQDTLMLGNLDNRRDWGFAGDYVRAMWLMLNQDAADDYVIATGQTHTVREFVEKACETAGIGIAWEGEGAGEKGRDTRTGKTIVEVSKKFFRPAEKTVLCGDAKKAREKLGWKPEIDFDGLVELMMKCDLDSV
ncbi:MAG: GDP-mannose 4,6-dehydratase [Chitinivibrionales bacterium]|nr:GDP-mannose 4,6-dehydratase [Chitinivibrionales bacterium]MBD3396320.1 GDP-mannose 4,6-dehydratase [Chitinivibrionales bacterium]